MKKLLIKLLGKKEKVLSNREKERVQLVEATRQQFLKLREKGLSIPVFTL